MANEEINEQEIADENISNILARQRNKHIPESIMEEIKKYE